MKRIKLAEEEMKYPKEFTKKAHKEKSFYEVGGVEEAERILDKIEFHYTPKIEINVMDVVYLQADQ